MTPRVPLRYRIAPGQSEVLYLELARAQAMQAGEEGAQSGIPPVQLEVKMGPAEPTPQRAHPPPVQITQVRISQMAEKMSPAQREQMEKMLAPLLQVQGWSEMDIQGRVRRGEFRGMEDVPPRLRTMLGNIRTALLTVPFPDEPLGARARWEVERKVQFSGVWVDQVVTYHIEKMDRRTDRIADHRATNCLPPVDWQWPARGLSSVGHGFRGRAAGALHGVLRGRSDVADAHQHPDPNRSPARSRGDQDDREALSGRSGEGVRRWASPKRSPRILRMRR